MGRNRGDQEPSGTIGAGNADATRGGNARCSSGLAEIQDRATNVRGTPIRGQSAFPAVERDVSQSFRLNLRTRDGEFNDGCRRDSARAPARGDATTRHPKILPCCCSPRQTPAHEAGSFLERASPKSVNLPHQFGICLGKIAGTSPHAVQFLDNAFQAEDGIHRVADDPSRRKPRRRATGDLAKSAGPRRSERGAVFAISAPRPAFASSLPREGRAAIRRTFSRRTPVGPASRRDEFVDRAPLCATRLPVSRTTRRASAPYPRWGSFGHRAEAANVADEQRHRARLHDAVVVAAHGTHQRHGVVLARAFVALLGENQEIVGDADARPIYERHGITTRSSFT